MPSKKRQVQSRYVVARTYMHSSPYFDPTHTRTGWIGQPPILNRHEVVTIDGDVDTLGQYVCMYVKTYECFW